MRRGFTIVEMLIVIAILVVLASIVTISLSQYTRSQVIASGVAVITTTLADARSRTLAARDGSQYGVHLDTGSVTLFKGDTYSVGAADNEVTPVDTRAVITPSLNGGGQDVVFERLSGETNDYGTIAVALSSDASTTKTIMLQQTGLSTQ